MKKPTSGDHDREPSSNNDMRLPMSLARAPECDVQAQMLAAAAVLNRTGDAGEVLEALGLDLIVEKRREVLRAAGRTVLR